MRGLAGLACLYQPSAVQIVLASLSFHPLALTLQGSGSPIPNAVVPVTVLVELRSSPSVHISANAAGTADAQPTAFTGTCKASYGSA